MNLDLTTILLYGVPLLMFAGQLKSLVNRLFKVINSGLDAVERELGVDSNEKPTEK